MSITTVENKDKYEHNSATSLSGSIHSSNVLNFLMRKWRLNISQTPTTQSFVFFVLLILLALGGVTHYALLDQIAMADNYGDFGFLYPNPDDTNLTTASVYFPGVSFVAIFLKKFIPNNYLIEAMLLLAVGVVISGYKVQKKIASNIIPGIKTENFQSFAIICALFIAPGWLLSAVRFKSDTLAFLLGALGIIISDADSCDDIKLVRFFFGACLTGVALIFKQQYIAFLVGMITYSLIKKNRNFQLFTAISVAFALIVVVWIYNYKNAWFWTNTVLVGDGLTTWKDWIFEHTLLGVRISQFCCIIYGLYLAGLFGKKENIQGVSWKDIFWSPWPTVLFFAAGGALAGSFKRGGCVINTDVGIMLLLPIIYFLFQSVEKRVLLLFSWALIIGEVGDVYHSYNIYSDAKNLTQAVKLLKVNKDARILTGSDVYGASRLILDRKPIENYCAAGTKNHRDYPSELINKLNNQNFDYLIVENIPSTKNYLSTTGNYSIVYENKLGIIAHGLNTQAVNRSSRSRSLEIAK